MNHKLLKFFASFVIIFGIGGWVIKGYLPPATPSAVKVKQEKKIFDYKKVAGVGAVVAVVGLGVVLLSDSLLLSIATRVGVSIIPKVGGKIMPGVSSNTGALIGSGAFGMAVPQLKKWTTTKQNPAESSETKPSETKPSEVVGMEILRTSPTLNTGLLMIESGTAGAEKEVMGKKVEKPLYLGNNFVNVGDKLATRTNWMKIKRFSGYKNPIERIAFRGDKIILQCLIYEGLPRSCGLLHSNQPELDTVYLIKAMINGNLYKITYLEKQAQEMGNLLNEILDLSQDDECVNGLEVIFKRINMYYTPNFTTVPEGPVTEDRIDIEDIRGYRCCGVVLNCEDNLWRVFDYCSDNIFMELESVHMVAVIKVDSREYRYVVSGDDVRELWRLEGEFLAAKKKIKEELQPKGNKRNREFLEKEKNLRRDFLRKFTKFLEEKNQKIP